MKSLFGTRIPFVELKCLWTVCLALVLSLIPPAAHSQTSSLPEALQSLFASGVEAQKRGDLDAAERAFTTVLAQGGKVSFVYNNLGAIYQQRRQYSQALEQFREAIRLEPHYAAPRILAGASLLALGKVSEAVKELELGVKLQPNEPLARLQLAQAYDRSGDVFGLVEQYQKLRDGYSTDPEYSFQVGGAFMKVAALCSQELGQSNPTSARYYQSVANYYVYQGNQKKAIDSLKRAIEADPKLPDLHLALAQLYAQQGQIAESLQQIDMELAIVPDSLAALTMKGNLTKR